ncbi:MAG TPA: LysR family transcriptional regulator [Myxococcota bacterium]|nr:LysR family transcriptional regulator [Myxococcota bacterium]
MTLDELETFVSIATGGGFTGASRRLHRSQPAISRRIQQLEQALDAELFERVGRSVRMSPAGRALLPFAEAALAAAREGERAVRGAAGAKSAPVALRLAMVGTLADSHVVTALRAFRRRFGDASLELRTATSREVSALVRRGEADLGLRYFADPDRALESLALGSERLHVVVPADHPMRARRVKGLAVFAGERWLAFPPDPRHPESSGLALDGLLRAAGVLRPVIQPVDSLTAQKRLVEAGLGIALLPASSFRDELRRGTLRTIAVAGLRAEQPVVAVRRRGAASGRAASEFLALLRKHTPDLRRAPAAAAP